MQQNQTLTTQMLKVNFTFQKTIVYLVIILQLENIYVENKKMRKKKKNINLGKINYLKEKEKGGKD